jgi:hypothetical protein
MSAHQLQHILVYLDFTELSNNLALWIAYIHSHLKHPVDLLFVIDHNTTGIIGNQYSTSDIENRMEIFRQSCGNPKGNNYIKEGCNCSMLSQLAEETDSLFCISAVHSRNDVQYLSSSSMTKMLKNSRIPCLVIPKNNQFFTPEKISVGIHIQPEQKSVIPWIAFLSKHLELPVDIFYNNEDSAIQNNIQFSGKFLKNHELAYKTTQIKKSGDIDRLCLKHIQKNSIHMLYLNKNNSFFSKLIGDADAKRLDNKNGLAILCINPKKDLFVPCT